MDFIKKYWPYIAGVVVLGLFFITRLFNILSLPIFTDEAIYVRWSQIAMNDATWRFISLTDGKQPMYVWVAIVMMRFIHDPLLAGRLVSVVAGLLSTIGMFFLGNEIFKNKKIGLLTSFIYVLYPFALVYDRLAIYDSLVAMFMIWSLYFEVLLIRNIRLDLAMVLGMVIGGGMLTKTSADFAMAFLPFSLLLFNFKDKTRKEKLIRWVIFAVVAVVIANAMYAILRLSPFYYIIGQKNLTFIYSTSEWIHNPFAYFSGNFKGLFSWLVGYMTIPFLLLVGASFVIGKKHFFEKILLLLWFISPFIYLAFFGKVIYPRFILFMTMPLLALGAYSLFYFISLFKQLWVKLVLVVVFLLMFVVNDYFIITDFAKAQIPFSDKGQLLYSWPAGVGVKETVAFVKQQSQNKKIFVGTEGTFGLMPYSLEIYFQNDPNVKIEGFWPIHDTPPQQVIDASKQMPTYFVFYQPCPSCKFDGIAPPTWPVTPIFQKERLQQNSFYTLYQVHTQ